MRKKGRRQHPEEQSCATVKRKHTHFEQFHYNKQTKRLKWVSTETKTATLKPDPVRNLPVSNNGFEAIRPCTSSSRRHNKRRKRSNCSSLEGSRKWVFSSRNCSNYKDKLVIVSYNILAAENVAKHPDLYLDVPPKFLEWSRRKDLISEEVNRYNASILCFQEVDRFKDLDDLLQKDGFKGVYKARTGNGCDGCALFWKDKIKSYSEHRFTLLQEENIDFQDFGLRNNVAQLCVLKINQHQLECDSCRKQSKLTPMQSRSLLVGNIHALFNPNRGDIKLGQVRLFLEKAYKLSQEWGSIPVILVGDFNSIPQSAIYQFLASSELNIQLHDRRRISGQLEYPSQGREIRAQNKRHVWMPVSRQLSHRWSDEELVLATGDEGVTHLQHKLKLCSAYAGIPGSSRTRDSHGEPLATSYHSKFMGTVDYIWHTGELVPVRVLETLPINILRRNASLPNERLGSDHLALVCELAFADGHKGA
ncbi:PREDICTED: carbon catabolite repressor protein 4 homolog 5 isoform X2 [Theobroma cacao]|uniref:Carbon catabolite repressor protein 4 homolog 5 isoform X2 n=1 Tax=Theobroma cacao TaxID=3641 RepID=A0AB32W3F1_THECC|nr:PREDICTED: carbon catabolite repressor protein 4 homolog 5 isoform X2 [Theobroma cacao]